MNPDFRRSLRGIFSLLRIVPVLTWSASAVVLGIGLALHRMKWTGINFFHLLILIFIISMLHGLAAHAINDLYDWLSGTDRGSPGILSGGSAALKNKLLKINQVKITAWAALALGIAGGLYLAWMFGILIFFLLLVGLWSAVAYTMPPVRLAYRPLAGEWLAAWPSAAASTLGTFYVLTGVITSYALAGSILHATFSIAWLMQHHLPDIEADLAAVPRKMTTVALIAQRWGKPSSRFVVMGYFILLTVLGLVFGWLYNQAFLISAAFGSVCVWLAYRTNPVNIKHIVSQQIGMMALAAGHALSLAAVFAWRIV